MTYAAQKRMEETRAYIRENFRPNDRLAVVILPRKDDSPQGEEREEERSIATQRIAAADRIISDDFQA